MLSIGNWLVEPETCTLRRDEERRRISPRAMDVLVCLAENAPQVVSVETLLNRFWPSHSASDHAVHKVLATLRQALGDTPAKPVYIKTFPKRGYAVIAEVTLALPQKSSAAVRKQSSAIAQTETPVSAPPPVTAPPTATASTTPGARSAPDRRRWPMALGVAACCALLLGFVLLMRATWPDNGPESGRVIAMQPVQLISTAVDSQQSWLALGLDAALNANLSQLPGLGILKLSPSEEEDADERAAAEGASHLFQTRILERDADLLVHVELTDLDRGIALYSEQLTVDAGNVLTAQEEIVSDVVAALRVVLDEKQRAAMFDWGTANPLAYEQFIKAEFYKDQWNHADWEAAIAHYRRAIDLDPLFVSAYTGLATAINYMVVYSSQETADELLLLLSDYTRGLELSRPGDPAIDILRTVQLTAGGVQLRDLAALYEQRIADGDAPRYLFAQFGLLLQGARLYREADQYLARADAESPYKTVPNQQANFRTGSLTPWEAIPVKKQQLFEQPRHVGILGSLVRFLALSGDLKQAEFYFERQQQVDLAGIRSHLSKINLAAASGELFRLRSLDQVARTGERFRYPELVAADTLADPDLQFNNGVRELILGDIGAAARHWRRLSPVDQRKLYTRLHASEYLIPDAVLRDPDYHALLESVGVGKSWQRQLMQSILALQPVTGVALSPAARRAWESNEFMSHNDHWSEAQLRRLESLKPVAPLRISPGECLKGGAEDGRC